MVPIGADRGEGREYSVGLVGSEAREVREEEGRGRLEGKELGSEGEGGVGEEREGEGREGGRGENVDEPEEISNSPAKRRFAGLPDPSTMSPTSTSATTGVTRGVGISARGSEHVSMMGPAQGFGKRSGSGGGGTVVDSGKRYVWGGSAASGGEERWWEAVERDKQQKGSGGGDGDGGRDGRVQGVQQHGARTVAAASSVTSGGVRSPTAVEPPTGLRSVGASELIATRLRYS